MDDENHEHETGTASKESTGSTTTVTSAEPVNSDTPDEAHENPNFELISSPAGYVFVGFVFLVIPAALFVWLGGVSWVRQKLGRDIGVKGKYKKVRSDDLEK